MLKLTYTQFAIQDSRLFGPNPWKILAPPSSYLSKKGFWATQPLEQILVAEFLLCELCVRGSQGAGVLSNSWFDRVLLSILRIVKPWS